MLDPDQGVHRGYTKIVTAVPHPIAFEETPESFRDHAGILSRTKSSYSHHFIFIIPGVIFNRRRTLDYDTFDSFSTDQKYCCFVQFIYQTPGDLNEEDFSLVCDCLEGVQGRMCIHKVAIYFKKGKMVMILIRTIYKS